MTMKEFGMWAAIAIHDPSSVVGAGSAYDAIHPELMASEGVSALEVATTIKLTRALWIVVLVLVTPFIMRNNLGRQTFSTSMARPSAALTTNNLAVRVLSKFYESLLLAFPFFETFSGVLFGKAR